MSTNPENVYKAAKGSDLEEVKRFLEHEEFADSVKKEIAYIAADKNDLNLLRCVVEKSPSIVKKTGDRHYSVLRRAVTSGALDVVKYLVEEHEANILYKSLTEPTTVVYLAIQKRHWDILKYFLENGNIDVDTPINASCETILLAATRCSADEHILKYLVENKKANLTAVDADGENILYKAILNTNHLNFIKYVLDELKAEIDINWRSKDGSTLLQYVFSSHREDDQGLVEYLVDEKHADVNIPNDQKLTPLHYVRTPRMCAYLVEHGVNVSINQKDWCGKTPFLRLVTDRIRDERDFDKFEILECLLKHGADINVRDKDGVTALNYATTKWSSPLKDELCEFLIKHGADINQGNNFGNTPLHFTIVGRLHYGMALGDDPDYKLFKYFIKHGADVNRANNDGETPLYWAVLHHRNTLYHDLLKQGADINARDKNGETLVYVAVDHKNTEILDDLVGERHANVNIARESDKMTPLHCAASHNDLNICHYLVENGADVLARDKDGRTPIEKASHEGVIQLLKTASVTRNRTSRSIAFPAPILLFPSVPHAYDPDKITADVSSSVNHWSIKGASSFVADSAYVSRIQSFLALVNALIRASQKSACRWPPSLSRTNARLQPRMDSFVEEMIDRLENRIF